MSEKEMQKVLKLLESGDVEKAKTSLAKMTKKQSVAPTKKKKTKKQDDPPPVKERRPEVIFTKMTCHSCNYTKMLPDYSPEIRINEKKERYFVCNDCCAKGKY